MKWKNVYTHDFCTHYRLDFEMLSIQRAGHLKQWFWLTFFFQSNSDLSSGQKVSLTETFLPTEQLGFGLAKSILYFSISPVLKVTRQWGFSYFSYNCFYWSKGPNALQYFLSVKQEVKTRPFLRCQVTHRCHVSDWHQFSKVTVQFQTVP